MALDRFVVWTDQVPTQAQVEQVLINFFGGAATIEWKPEQQRFYCTLPGKNTFPFKDLVPKDRSDRAQSKYEAPFDVRFIEVFLGQDSLDIITRMQDEYTNAISQGLQSMFCRFWGAHPTL